MTSYAYAASPQAFEIVEAERSAGVVVLFRASVTWLAHPLPVPP
jgi:hypothetical protein